MIWEYLQPMNYHVHSSVIAHWLLTLLATLRYDYFPQVWQLRLLYSHESLSVCRILQVSLCTFVPPSLYQLP